MITYVEGVAALPSGGSSEPKPKPPPVEQRWFQERPSPYAWEQDGLDHIKRLMPNAEPYRAWATFSFTAASGRINECDLLIAVPGGLYLVELKGHPGHVVNKGETWKVYEDGARYPRTLRNPLHLTDLKCKDLKTRLDWALKKRGYKLSTPWIEPAVFLSATGLRSELDKVQSAKVYGRDGECEGLPWIWRDLLSRPPQQDNRRVKPEFSKLLPELLDDIGISAATSHLRFGDGWSLKPEKLDAGPTWEDRLAERSDLVKEEGRVRIYLTAQQASAEQRLSVDRAARREYQVLQGINHRGIAQAVQIAQHQGGPAILFRHRHTDLRLDSYLDVFGEQLSIETRLDLVRQLAEAVQYAHQRSLYHRALSARSVYVSAKNDGSQPVLRIIDWQAAARDFDTTMGTSSLGNSSVTGEHLADSTEVYLAPDFDTPYADPVDLDVFGLGTLAYFLLTGEPPATQRKGLIERLRTNKGLRPSAVADGISDELDVLVFEATRGDPNDRLQSADEFLKRLDKAEAQSVPDAAAPIVDPLEVSAGQTLDGCWTVVRVLGTGATARALLVQRIDEDDDHNGKLERRVFKVALDEEKAEHLLAEARALNEVGGGAIVKLLEPPRQLGGRTLLELEYAGGFDLNGQTLGEAIRAEGKLSYHNLERYGRDLFTALDALVAKGVRHRDLKPDNFGVFRRADRSTQLMLFDFSLAGVSERDVKAGTAGYLDPFLGTDRRPAYDDHAERYAAAVTLHEMASGQRPVWGDGMTDPRTTDDETPIIASDLFEPALRDQLNEFFLRAFHRDVDKRFDTFQQMEDAWREVFRKADSAQPITTSETVDIDQSSLEEIRDAHARAATLDTLLDAAGLSPRAVSVAASFDATTVRELLDVPPYLISKARGSGAAVRKELNRRHKQWSQALLKEAKDDKRPPLEGRLTIDDLAARLAPQTSRRNSKRAEAVRLTLGLPDDQGVPKSWPTQSEVAKKLDVTQATVSNHMRSKAAEWADDPHVTAVRDELVALLADAGRVMAAEELAAALRARRGSVEQDPARARARALAIVRAAVETEVWVGSHRDGEDDEARLQMLRRGGHVVIALESLVGTTDPSAPELADFAIKLGVQADDLVKRDPLPGRGAVVRELRAIEPPEGLARLADTRLVELAAAMSDNAAASPRLELYPRKLDLVRALRISQAPTGVRRENGITQQDLLAKVKARFPLLELDERMTHVELEDALKSAGFELEYDPTERRFRPPALEPSRLASSSYTTVAGRDARAVGLDPSEVTHAKLSSAVERGGFVALTLRGNHLPGAADALALVYPVRAVNVDAAFLSAFRELVDERGQDWGKVRRLDRKFSETGVVTRGLASYVSAAWDRVWQRLLEEALEPGSVLFLHHASLLGRYFDEGGRGLLTELQNAARRPDDAPHGLWLLCPVHSASETPKLEQRIVEVLGESERVVLDGEFLAGLRAGSGSAA
ncbi:BREX system serine/threonine kinase PglW [Saccharopolyspora rosea]|uniref:BREX system serine/threonine kinase PglW n=1 Tax=Saccharopolyspora rosea TaxID=524884 RepID=A0ABW3G506_9PSEU